MKMATIILLCYVLSLVVSATAVKLLRFWLKEPKQ